MIGCGSMPSSVSLHLQSDSSTTILLSTRLLENYDFDLHEKAPVWSQEVEHTRLANMWTPVTCHAERGTVCTESEPYGEGAEELIEQTTRRVFVVSTCARMRTVFVSSLPSSSCRQSSFSLTLASRDSII